jgi:integrase
VSTELKHEDNSEVYKNFINSLDSEITKKCYRVSLIIFMRFVKSYDYDQLVKLDRAKLENIIRDYIIHLKQERKLSPATVSAYLAAVAHFYEMNDVTINWRKLKKFKAKFRSIVEDRPYTRDEIAKLIDVAPLRDKCIILLMASSGMRRGAIPYLRLKDFTRIDEYHLYHINVYKKEQESYVTYCTPECSKYIDEYLEWRKRLGEKLIPTSPLFRLSFDTITEINRPQPITTHVIENILSKLLDFTGIRAATNNPRNRSEIMQSHAFRKFFKTICINAGMNPLYSEYVMGHRSGLTKSYFKPGDMELLEGSDKALGYTAVINDLTINEDYRLHRKIDELIKKKDEIEIMEMKHREEIKTMRDQMSQIMTMIRQNPKLAKVKPEVLVNHKIRE